MVIYYIARKKTISQDWERFVAYAVGMSACAALVHEASLSWGQNFLGGGVVGMHFFNLCHTFLDTVGSTLLLYTMIIASLFVLTRISIATLFYATRNMAIATQRFFKKYKIMQHAAAAVKAICYGIYRLSHAWYVAMKSVIDGSAFYEAGYIAPDDDFYFKTMMHDLPEPLETISHTEKSKDII